MPSNTLARGNEIIDSCFGLTVTPPTITTATGTQQNITVPGLLVGDIISWNLTTTGANYNALITIANCFVSAANTLVITWTTEGATVSGAAAQTVLLEFVRIENFGESGVAGIPTNAL